MVDKRSGKDRRVNKDRRKGGISSYSGPENRGLKQQRSNEDRREINNNSFMKRALSSGIEGRRSGIDPRQFSYSGIIPERRSGKNRRGFVDRRTK
jgi:hypothetical protein